LQAIGFNLPSPVSHLVLSVYPLPIDEESPFLGEACALCKAPFVVEDEIIICPDDATRHHVACWQANNNHCTAYGCEGKGVVVDEEFVSRRVKMPDDGTFRRTADGQSKVRVLPSRSFSCAQSCLVLMIGVAILVFAFSCFGLWAILDYFMLNVWGFEYREPIGWLILGLG
jgi:hypothetical protein